jgi:hypothetical protein
MEINSKIMILRTAFYLLLCFPNLALAQEAPKKSEKGGWAIHMGAGFIYGGNIGLLGERQIHVKGKFRVSPFCAVGWAEGETDSVSHKNSWLGFSTGLTMEYGVKHRLIFGPLFVYQQLLGSSVEVKKNQLPGASFILGYKGTANFGLIWQIYIGDIYTSDPNSNSKKYEHSSHMGLGLGYKF